MAEKVAGALRSLIEEAVSARLRETAVSPKGTPVAASEASGPGPERTFFDSNILLYAEDSRFPAKQERALELILHHRKQNSAVLSLQILQEYFSNATRKLNLDPAEAQRKVEIYARFHLVEPRLADVFEAIDISRLYQINYWDAMVVHCAAKSGCRTVLTEDLQNGQIIKGVRLVNPFL